MSRSLGGRGQVGRRGREGCAGEECSRCDEGEMGWDGMGKRCAGHFHLSHGSFFRCRLWWVGRVDLVGWGVVGRDVGHSSRLDETVDVVYCGIGGQMARGGYAGGGGGDGGWWLGDCLFRSWHDCREGKVSSSRQACEVVEGEGKFIATLAEWMFWKQASLSALAWKLVRVHCRSSLPTLLDVEPARLAMFLMRRSCLI